MHAALVLCSTTVLLVRSFNGLLYPTHRMTAVLPSYDGLQPLKQIPQPNAIPLNLQINDVTTVVPRNSIIEANQSGLIAEPLLDVTPQVRVRSEDGVQGAAALRMSTKTERERGHVIVAACS